jgi:hypothetical protein
VPGGGAMDLAAVQGTMGQAPGCLRVRLRDQSP